GFCDEQLNGTPEGAPQLGRLERPRKRERRVVQQLAGKLIEATGVTARETPAEAGEGERLVAEFMDVVLRRPDPAALDADARAEAARSSHAALRRPRGRV